MEKIEAVIPRVRKGVNSYALFFTDQNIIKAITYSGKKRVAAYIGGFALGTVIGLCVAELLTRSSARKKSSKLAQLDPKEILNADKRNLMIPYSSITKIVLKKGSTFSAPKITIITASESDSMTIQEKDEFDSYRLMLKKIIPNKLYVESKNGIESPIQTQTQNSSTINPIIPSQTEPKSSNSPSEDEKYLDILKERLVKGEITKEEYQELKDVLK